MAGAHDAHRLGLDDEELQARMHGRLRRMSGPAVKVTRLPGGAVFDHVSGEIRVWRLERLSLDRLIWLMGGLALRLMRGLCQL